jgi:hypothetical protein
MQTQKPIKTREKTKVPENHGLCWISLRQKKDSEYLLSRPLPLLFLVTVYFLTSTSIFKKCLIFFDAEEHCEILRETVSCDAKYLAEPAVALRKK